MALKKNWLILIKFCAFVVYLRENKNPWGLGIVLLQEGEGLFRGKEKDFLFLFIYFILFIYLFFSTDLNQKLVNDYLVV